MVKLGIDLITKYGPGHNKRRPDETATHYLSRLTHIYLQEKNIDQIFIDISKFKSTLTVLPCKAMQHLNPKNRSYCMPYYRARPCVINLEFKCMDPIPLCKNLTVIYLYDNSIEKIENLEFAPNLTHLYLQNNKIKRLENLANFKKLTKLHIGGNSIRVLEGLETLTELNELHIENQNLPSGEKLLFDPRTLITLVSQLTILNISGNNLDTLSEIGPLMNLEQLMASNNNLNDMKEMAVLLKCWPKLWKLELGGNPICMKNKYRERIIVLAPNIVVLDGKEIQELSRQFLQNWKISKEVSIQKTKTDSPSQESPNNNSANKNIQFDSDSFSIPASTLNGTSNNSELPRINKINSMPTYVMPEHRKKQYSNSGLNSKLRSQKYDEFANAYLTNNIITNNNNNNNLNLNNHLSSIIPKTNGFSANRYSAISSKTKMNSYYSENNLVSTQGYQLAPLSALSKASNKNMLQTGFVYQPKE